MLYCSKNIHTEGREKMKKILAVLLVLAMAFSLCACAPLENVLDKFGIPNPFEEEYEEPLQQATLPAMEVETIAPTMPMEAVEAVMPMPTEPADDEAPAVPTEPINPVPVGDDVAMQTVEQILSASNMSVDEAYVMAFSIESGCEEHLKLREELAALKACQGIFIQHSESSSRTYKADVSFYLQYGEYWFTIDYAGYTGTIKDGKVDKNAEGAFLFDAESTGSHTNLFTGELMVMDFYIQFGQESMYITWGTSEYYLSRT